MNATFVIKNMKTEEVTFLGGKLAPAFGVEVLQCKASWWRRATVLTVEGTPANVMMFENYFKTEIKSRAGTFVEA